MQSQPDNNQTLPETNKQLFNQPRSMIITIGLLIFLLAGAIFLLGAISTGQGSDCWFSILCKVIDGGSTLPIPPTPIPDIAGAVAGTSAAIVLMTVVEAPLTVAVGVGVVVWLLLRSWL
jgi:hypothetical protein